MGFTETLAAHKVPGQKGAFLIDASGACQTLNCDQAAALQSTELAKQIADIVGLPNLDTVWIASDNGTIGIKATSRGTAGAWLSSDGDVAAARGLLDALIPVTAAARVELGADAVNQIRKIATEYLTDFAETALMIQIKQAGLDEKNPQPDQLAKLAGGLEKAALMIVGPSRAREMGEKLKKVIS